MRRKLLTVGLVLVMLVAVYALKVWHAVGVCEDAGGDWTGADCVFHERSDPSLTSKAPGR